MRSTQTPSLGRRRRGLFDRFFGHKSFRGDKKNDYDPYGTKDARGAVVEMLAAIFTTYSFVATLRYGGSARPSIPVSLHRRRTNTDANTINNVGVENCGEEV